MSPQNYLTDRSACDLDDKCGMAYWWNRMEGERGLVPVQDALPLRIGSEIHSDLEWCARVELKEELLEEKLASLIASTSPQTQQQHEHLWRRLGWLTAYFLYIEPGVREIYEDVLIEAELILDRSPFWVAITPDRVLRNRSTGKLVYREYKSAKMVSNRWINSWVFQIQPHIGMLAVEEELDERVEFTQIMGIMKGEERSGRLVHPYVWAYHNTSTDQWESEYAKARSGGWEPAPLWERGMDPKLILEWVKRLGEETARGQFPHSNPIFLNRRMVEDWVGRRTAREMEIRAIRESATSSWEERVVHFPMRTSNCRPAYGDMCPYLQLCWHAESQREPLRSGLYKPRTPHHLIELLPIE